MIGCLLIHGFSGNPKEVEPLAVHLQQLGFQVYAPTLAGHHGDLEEFKRSKWTDWVDSAEQSLLDLMKKHQRIYLIGFSMGGLIAAHLATRYPVERLVLLSPAMFYPNLRQLMLDICDGWVNTRGKDFMPECLKRYLARALQISIRPLWQFRQLVHHLRADLPRVNVPTLIIHGKRDEVIHPRSAKYIYDTIGSKEKRLHYLPNSKHIVCHDQERETVKTLVQSFLPHSV